MQSALTGGAFALKLRQNIIQDDLSVISIFGQRRYSTNQWLLSP
jgi:hypothetical protein